MSVTYSRPPLREAIFELRSELEVNLSAEKIELFYSKIAHLFPTKAKGHNFFIKSGPSKNNPDELEVEQKMEQFDRFLNETSKTNLHLTNNGVLSIHKLEPYQSWQEFFPIIQEVIAIFNEMFQLSNTERLGLRYINEITIPEEGFKLEDYFNYDLNLSVEGKIISQQLNLFFSLNEDNDRINVKISEASQNVVGNKKFILDLDYFSIKITSCDLESVFAWIDNAHNNIETYFESIISAKTKEFFN